MQSFHKTARFKSGQLAFLDLVVIKNKNLISIGRPQILTIIL